MPFLIPEEFVNPEFVSNSRPFNVGDSVVFTKGVTVDNFALRRKNRREYRINAGDIATIGFIDGLGSELSPYRYRVKMEKDGAIIGSLSDINMDLFLGSKIKD